MHHVANAATVLAKMLQVPAPWRYSSLSAVVAAVAAVAAATRIHILGYTLWSPLNLA